MRPRAIAVTLVLTACSATGSPTTTPTTTTPPATTAASTTLATAPPTAATTTTAPVTTTTTLPRFDPFAATIPELQQAMADGRLTAVDLVRFSLDRIATHEPDLAAMLFVNPDAIFDAERLDAERAAGMVRGPLHGIPVVLKDNIGTGDMPTTAASLSLAGFIPGADADQVRLLREAGAIVIGKANLHEFARDILTVSSLGGQTRNPYALDRYPGGSSGGTGAAVAAQFAVVGLGSDSCGSIRIPSGFNHLYGLRPTFGLTSVEGVIPLTWSEDTVGPMARSAIDLAIVLDATTDGGTRYADAAAAGSLEGVRIGVLEFLVNGADPAVRATVRTALDRMAAAGAEVVPAPFPGFDALRGSAASIYLREWRYALDQYLAGQPDAPVQSMAEIAASGDYHPTLGGAISRALAATLDSAEYRDAVARRDRVRDGIEEYLDAHDLDALAYPPIPSAPAMIGTAQRGTNCGTASVGGLPAIVVPAGFTGDGLPIGLELLGAAFAEERLIAIAAGYEAASPAWVPPFGE